VREVSVEDLAGLAAALDAVRRDEFVIRGEPLDGTSRNAAPRRAHPDPVTGAPATFREVPRRHLLLDLDDLPGPYPVDPRDGELAAAFARARLPPAFARASCWWQLTAGHTIKPGLRLRLAFWLDRAVGRAELARRFAAAPVDHAVFGAVQPIYVARPSLRGVPDPVPRRSGVLLDVDDAVPVPEPPVETAAAAATASPWSQLGTADFVAAVQGELERVALAGAGARNATLFRAAARLGRFVASGELDARDIGPALVGAALAAGLPRPEAERTALGGLRTALRRAG
jgi:hypothetical protein